LCLNRFDNQDATPDLFNLSYVNRIFKMKKLFLLFILMLPSVYLINAMDGDGSSSNPFRGTLSGSETWSVGEFTDNTIYIGNSTTPDLTIATDGHLTIDPGITVIFTQLTSDLFITGTGQLTAGGSGSQVKFTKDPGKSHWGHISFQNMGTNPVASSFYNCLLEYGYSTGSGSQPLLAGGAIQVDFNDVMITKCSFIDNYATFAGAIMINSNRNTKIKNCFFESNETYECGGAIILYTNSTAELENCIFAYNYSKGNSASYYSGGAIWSYSNASKIVNCTFVENTSDRAGDAVYSYSSSNMQIINSIFWGTNDQFAYISTSPTISYSAFESVKPSTATNSIIISDVASDHFNDAGNGDWSLKFISPCRDAGTVPSPTVPNDYAGNPRIGPYDIGAYEVQYSRWKTDAGTTDWATASNWDGGVPSSSTDVIIPTGATNYPTGSTTQDFTLGSGKQFIIKQGAKVTLDDFTNNGTLKLNHDASGFASLIINSYTRGSGATEEIQLYLTGGGSELNEDYKWHYISTPVSSLSTDVFTGVTLDLAQFVESRPSSSLMQGWVAFDGYVYSTGQSNGPTFNSLTPGKGYNFWDGSNNTFTFGGLLNTSDAVMSLGYSGLPTMHGFNLLGNPFTSGLDWDDIINSVYATYPLNTSKGLYFTRDNIQCTYIAGVGVPGDVTGIIPPMQGFFTKTYSTGNSITLPAATRTHDNIHPTYKGSEVIPLVRLLLKRSNVITDETVIRFDALAKSDLDNDFDAIKMFISESKTQIYSSMGGVNYAINGQPFPVNALEIPIVINLTKDTIHTISVTQLQGLDDLGVYLRDNSTGFVADLKTTPVVTFSGGPGTINDRFVLSFTNTGFETPNILNVGFNIYQANSLINIQTISDEWDGMKGSVRLLDITGKTVTTKQDAEFGKNSMLEISAPSVKGLYIIELKSGLMRYVGKVVVK
jgi:hypothetical protein